MTTEEFDNYRDMRNPNGHPDRIKGNMVPHTQTEPILKGELEYGSILPNGEDWRLRKFDAGMGETEYRIFKNEKFFAQFDNWKDASTVMMMITCTPKNELRFYKNCICDKFADCFDCVKHYEIRKQILSCNHGDCEECEHLAWSFVAAREQERDAVLKGRKLYRCNSDTCSDNGGVCILCVPDMDFEAPTSCVNPEAFTNNGDVPDCKWEEPRQQGKDGEHP